MRESANSQSVSRSLSAKEKLARSECVAVVVVVVVGS